MSAQVSQPVTPINPIGHIQPINSSDTITALTFTTANPAWVQTIEPDSYSENGMSVSGIIPLSDSRQIGSLSNKRFVEAVVSELQRQLADDMNVPGTVLSRLTINGYGAPTGNHRNNEVRSTARAMELKQYLLSLKGWSANSLEVTWTAEDWSGILSRLEKAEFRLKTAAVDIIQNVDVNAGREQQLMMLDGGALYARLQQTVFPEVSRIEYTAELVREDAVSSSSANSQVSLSDMYHTAVSLRKGSDEYCDLLDLSARLYPGSVVACINAAAVALIRGDLDRAKYLLAGLETDPRAYCNLGVYYMLNDEPEKAEIYLLMAASNGVSEAKAAIVIMNNGE